LLCAPALVFRPGTTAFERRATPRRAHRSIDREAAGRAASKSAQERIVTAPEVVERLPNLIIGSWRGKKFRPEKVTARPGSNQPPAVRNGAI
jgi:hypothetical protein